MNAFGGPEVHAGEIPPQYKTKFHNDIAHIQVRARSTLEKYLSNRWQATMASIRFPKIGMILQLEDGSYDIGPVPGLGGPFETAQEYFAAWAHSVQFSTSEETIRPQVPSDFADELVLSIRQFPTQFKEALNRLPISTGPFPLHHPDFYHSNVIIDDAYNISSIIDWDGAGTVPWEVVQFPMFLYTVPPPIDLPSKYDHDGYPCDCGDTETLEGTGEYIEYVKEAEGRKALDSKLSTILACHGVQNLATSIRLYKEEGKVGDYCRLLQTTDLR